MSISNKGKNTLKELANEEGKINYKTFYFKSDSLAIDNYDFLKRFGTLYGLLINLRNEKISLRESGIEQYEMITKIQELKNFISSEKEKINKEKKQRHYRERKDKNTKNKNYFNTKKCFK